MIGSGTVYLKEKYIKLVNKLNLRVRDMPDIALILAKMYYSMCETS